MVWLTDEEKAALTAEDPYWWRYGRRRLRDERLAYFAEHQPEWTVEAVREKVNDYSQHITLFTASHGVLNVDGDGEIHTLVCLESFTRYEGHYGRGEQELKQSVCLRVDEASRFGDFISSRLAEVSNG